MKPHHIHRVKPDISMATQNDTSPLPERDRIKPLKPRPPMNVSTLNLSDAARLAQGTSGKGYLLPTETGLRDLMQSHSGLKMLGDFAAMLLRVYVLGHVLPKIKPGFLRYGARKAIAKVIQIIDALGEPR